ncbi:MAG TPA: hypothetical protein VML55_25790 [Planctomycetaceae bacterium]|nr:hypothetical protein [Planctomycetaceae bacterium]
MLQKPDQRRRGQHGRQAGLAEVDRVGRLDGEGPLVDGTNPGASFMAVSRRN